MGGWGFEEIIKMQGVLCIIMYTVMCQKQNTEKVVSQYKSVIEGEQGGPSDESVE